MGMKKENDILNGKDIILDDQLDFYDTLLFIRRYLETTVRQMNRQLVGKDREIAMLRQELSNAQSAAEGNKQLFNKLLGDLARLNNDIEWYKKTYEQRSFLGTVREKLFRKHSSQ